MGENVEIMDQVQIRWKGTYDFGGLYRLIRKWLDDHKYDFMETKYKDKIATDSGNEVEIIMTPELKVNEYIMFHIRIQIKNWEFKDYEIMVDGHKKKVSDGRIVIWMNATVEHDYSGRYKTPFEKKIHKFLIETALKRYFEIKYYDVLTYDLYRLQEDIKKHLNMEHTYNAF
jgi:hypothetical protein